MANLSHLSQYASRNRSVWLRILSKPADTSSMFLPRTFSNNIAKNSLKSAHFASKSLSTGQRARHDTWRRGGRKGIQPSWIFNAASKSWHQGVQILVPSIGTRNLDRNLKPRSREQVLCSMKAASTTCLSLYAKEPAVWVDLKFTLTVVRTTRNSKAAGRSRTYLQHIFKPSNSTNASYLMIVDSPTTRRAMPSIPPGRELAWPFRRDTGATFDKPSGMPSPECTRGNASDVPAVPCSQSSSRCSIS
mmetsp:Transcript_100477/g.322390  ORF Transcript_100477/g.322390 Transcript_100477/m.322390 type:complete len:247 (+) Transcript_100477:392-1132(+)